MKLFIEIEISPEEVSLATELLSTIRALTDHVKTRNIGKLLHGLLIQLQDSTQWDVAANEICTLLKECSSEMVSDDFSTTFTHIVLPDDLGIQTHNVQPFMLLLPRLPEQIKTKIKDILANKVLKHFMIRRSSNTNRSELLTHAEVFAALLSSELFPVTGAVKTISTWLQKPEHRCAGITVLGKTVERCASLLTDKCDSELLGEVISGLRIASEEAYQPDIQYIVSKMGWSQLLQTGSFHHGKVLISSSNSLYGSIERILDQGLTHGLFPIKSFVGHKNTIYTIAYDEQCNELVSGGKDGFVITWSEIGEIVETFSLHRHYACSMDISPLLHTLFICGVASENVLGSSPLPAPCIFRYEAVSQGWKQHGNISKDSFKFISNIKAINGGNNFVTTETSLINDGGSPCRHELVCYYDAQVSFASLQPVKQYEEHEDLVSCISPYPPNQFVFMSGSRDCTIRVWDCRTDRCIGMLGVGEMGRFKAHNNLVTSIDADETSMVISCGLDGYVNQWDLRMMANKIVDSPVTSMLLDDTITLKGVLVTSCSMPVVIRSVLMCTNGSEF
ncbi:hypothetical protein SUGI_0607780 [Cryptomeria japonica]|nr:hypothetical protein SUGI_0607780 [Cryptomeria japonica]